MPFDDLVKLVVPTQFRKLSRRWDYLATGTRKESSAWLTIVEEVRTEFGTTRDHLSARITFGDVDSNETSLSVKFFLSAQFFNDGYVYP